MYILYDSIGIKFKIRQNKSLVYKVKLRVSLARDVWNGGEHEKLLRLRGSRNALFLHGDSAYVGVLTLKI